MKRWTINSSNILLVTYFILNIAILSFLGIGPKGGDAHSSRHICRTTPYVPAPPSLSPVGCTYRRNDPEYVSRWEEIAPFGADAPSLPYYIHSSTKIGHRVLMTTNTFASVVRCDHRSEDAADYDSIWLEKNPVCMYDDV